MKNGSNGDTASPVRHIVPYGCKQVVWHMVRSNFGLRCTEIDTLNTRTCPCVRTEQNNSGHTCKKEKQPTVLDHLILNVSSVCLSPPTVRPCCSPC